MGQAAAPMRPSAAGCDSQQNHVSIETIAGGWYAVRSPRTAWVSAPRGTVASTDFPVTNKGAPTSMSARAHGAESVDQKAEVFAQCHSRS
jgi:hypothetical protein